MHLFFQKFLQIPQGFQPCKHITPIMSVLCGAGGVKYVGLAFQSSQPPCSDLVLFLRLVRVILKPLPAVFLFVRVTALKSLSAVLSLDVIPHPFLA